MDDVIAAKLEVHIRRADGTTVPFVARVGVPAPADVDWRCEVETEDGTDGEHSTQFVYGVDAWQALTLALKYVRVNVECAIPPGGQLLRLGKPTDLATLFEDRVGA